MLGKTLGVLYRISLVTYDGTVLRYLEGSTEVIEESKFECLFLGAWLGSLGGLDIGTDDCIAL